MIMITMPLPVLPTRRAVSSRCAMFEKYLPSFCLPGTQSSFHRPSPMDQINLVIGTTYQAQGSKVNRTAAIEVRGETRKIIKSLS